MREGDGSSCFTSVGESGRQITYLFADGSPHGSQRRLRPAMETAVSGSAIMVTESVGNNNGLRHGTAVDGENGGCQVGASNR